MCARSKVFKRCKTCNKMKSLSDYYVNEKNQDKRESMCKSCYDKINK